MPVATGVGVYDFALLFKGRSNAFGIHEPSTEIEANGKRKGKSYTKEGILSSEVYTNHLNGVRGLGVVPICEDDRCYFGAIDVDEYNGERDKIISLIYRHNLPLNPFRSKSGGLHLFLFFSHERPISAPKVIGFLSEYRELLGLPIKTEIFPKQRSVSGGIGNWINLPYFGDSDRALLGEDGRLIPFEDALRYLKERRFTEDSLRRQLDDMPFADGPPCIQTLFVQGNMSPRNTFLFSAARYYKSKFGVDEFEGYTLELNNALAEPLEEAELQKSVLTSHRKKDYSYKCSDAPLSGVCNKAKCKGRRFGIGNSEVSELSFGTLSQYMEDPPRYEWEINGKVLSFFDENDLIKQGEFQRQCVRLLHTKPSQLKQEAWDNIVNAALKNVKIVEVDLPSTMSLGARFKNYLAEFLTKRAMAATKGQLLLDRVFLDPDTNEYVFKGNSLNDFLVDTKRFHAYTSSQVGERLRVFGAYTERYFVDSKNPKVPVWKLPADVIKDHVVNTESMADLDFMPNEKDEEF